MASGKKILLVEDEVIIAMDSQQRLKSYGYEVTCAHSGEKAVDYGSSDPSIELILMDIDLGRGMDGIEAATRILAVRDLPVVFVSSHTEPSVVGRTEEVTSYGYVVKNSGMTILDASIKMAFKLFEEKRKVARQQGELEAANAALEERNLKLRVAEARFRGFFEQAAVGMAYLRSTTGEFITVNQKFCDIVGYAEAELTVLDFKSITHPEDLPRDLRLVEDLLAGRIRSFSAEKRYVRKDGDVVWVNLWVSPLWEPGEAPEYNLAIAEDITGRKAVEAALADSEEKYRKIVEGAADAIFINEAGVRVSYANPACVRLFGARGPEDLVGRDPRTLFHPDSLPLAGERINALLREKRPVPPLRERVLRLDGTAVDVETSAVTYEARGVTSIQVTMRALSRRGRG